MRKTKLIWLVLSILILGAVTGGCNLFPNSNTRPAPVRPRNILNQRTIRVTPKARVTPKPGATPKPATTPRLTNRTRPAPSKRIKGLSGISERSLLDRITRIEQAALRGNWGIANRNTNTLGLEMARFRPTRPGGKTLREIGSFDAIYAKLQADVRMKNRTAVFRDTRRLKAALSGMKKTA